MTSAKARAKACKAAGVAGRLRHDFRRAAERNMVNTGVPERVTMKMRITGHRSRAVFDRYHIVDAADLQGVAERIASIGVANGLVSRHSRPRAVETRRASV